METSILTKHRTVTVSTSFEGFNERLQSLLGKIENRDFELIARHPETARAHLAALGGFEDLMLFGIQEHGALLRLAGQQRNALQYILGNPLIALEMTSRDIRAALYAPLRLLVYEESAGNLNIEYDLPSSLFGQFGDPEILKTGMVLDSKLEKLISACSAA